MWNKQWRRGALATARFGSKEWPKFRAFTWAGRIKHHFLIYFTFWFILTDSWCKAFCAAHMGSVSSGMKLFTGFIIISSRFFFLSGSQGFKYNTVGRYFTWHQSERRKISEICKINCPFCEKHLSLFILLSSIFISIKCLWPKIFAISESMSSPSNTDHATLSHTYKFHVAKKLQFPDQPEKHFCCPTVLCGTWCAAGLEGRMWGPLIRGDASLHPHPQSPEKPSSRKRGLQSWGLPSMFSSWFAAFPRPGVHHGPSQEMFLGTRSPPTPFANSSERSHRLGTGTRGLGMS